jgi:universal stress protein A
MGSRGPEFAYRAAMPSAPTLQRILVPVDFSDCSAAALQQALMLQRVAGAHIHVLHTYDLPALAPANAMLLVGELDASPVQHAQRFTTQRLAEFLAKLSIQPSDTLRTSIAVGEAAATIVEQAEGDAVDLIVMGTHGRTGWSRALLGSTAERVLHAAPCAVLTVKVPPITPDVDH